MSKLFYPSPCFAFGNSTNKRITDWIIGRYTAFGLPILGALSNFYYLIFCKNTIIFILPIFYKLWMFFCPVIFSIKYIFRILLKSASCFFWMCIMSISLASCKTTFNHGINSIFFNCSNKKMFRIYASTIITFVAHAHFFRYKSMRNKIRNSMCAMRSIIWQIKSTITIVKFARFPFPTFIWPAFVNFRPKSISVFFGYFNHIYFPLYESIT